MDYIDCDDIESVYWSNDLLLMSKSCLNYLVFWLWQLNIDQRFLFVNCNIFLFMNNMYIILYKIYFWSKPGYYFLIELN